MRGPVKYFICGFSGCGKTTRLNLLREKPEYKDYAFIDLDDYIFKNFGYSYHSLADLITDKGLKWFRQTERDVLLKLIEENDNIWIALGGGSLDEELASILSKHADIEGFRVQEDFDTCWSRIKNDSKRPLVALGESKMREIYNKRQNIYRKFKVLIS